MILLTGGSGFIGRHFHDQIPHNQIVNFDLQAPEFDTKSAYVKGDIRVKSDLADVFKRFPIKSVISLAAKHHDFGIGHDEYFDTNEDGTRALCEAASEAGVTDITFYSSVAVYGLQNTMSTETLQPKPDSPYGASKLAGEKVLLNWCSQSAANRLIILRPTVVYGANNRANMYNLIRQIDSGLYFHIGKADNLKSIAYVENLVQATLYLKQTLAQGNHVYNYADEPQLTSFEIAEKIAHELNTKIRVTLPRWLALTLGKPFDLAIWLTGRNLPVSSQRIKKLNTETLHSARKLFDDGFSPKFSTLDGLEKMVRWYRTQVPAKR